MQRITISQLVIGVLSSPNIYRSVLQSSKYNTHILQNSSCHLSPYKFDSYITNNYNNCKENLRLSENENNLVQTRTNNKDLEVEENYVPLVLDPPFTSVRGEKESKALLEKHKETSLLSNINCSEEREKMESMECEQIKEDNSTIKNNQEHSNLEIVYCCARCHACLFSSTHYASSSADGIHQSGWPSFLEPLEVNGLESIKMHSLSQKTVVQQSNSLEISPWEIEECTSNDSNRINMNNRRLQNVNIQKVEGDTWQQTCENNFSENYSNKNTHEQITHMNNSKCKWKIASRNNTKSQFVSKHDAMMANLSREIQQHIPHTSLAYRGESIEKDHIHVVGKPIMRLKMETRRERNIRHPGRRSEKLVHEGCCANCALPVCRVVYHHVYVPVNLESEEELEEEDSSEEIKLEKEEQFEREKDELNINSKDATMEQIIVKNRHHNNNSEADLIKKLRTSDKNKINKITKRETTRMRKQRELCFVVSPSRVYATLSTEV